MLSLKTLPSIQALPIMSDSFLEIEQDNNPLFYGDGKPDSSYLQDSFVDFGLHALVNDSLGLSQRIKKLLQNPRLQINVITTERMMNSATTVYLIELSVEGSDPIIVKRRYSEFKSLRDNLVKLFPSVIIPPIPEKHTILTYLINSIDSSKEMLVIDVRKRYFTQFLRDVVFDSNVALRNCPLVLKFLDPNYELCWENAVNEPPVNQLPQNLLLANPNDTTDQNGLYMLLPSVAGFDLHSSDHLLNLLKMNDDLHHLSNDIRLYSLKELNIPDINDAETPRMLKDIPLELVAFERSFHANIKVLSDLNKLNSKNIRNLKLMVETLIELGGNLNNFSLQIHEMAVDPTKHATPPAVDHSHRQLSVAVEKFGLTIDSNFLSLEHFVHSHVIPHWEEPINQFMQYYYSALQLVKFYKYKLLQFKLLYKLKFSKILELSNSAQADHQSLRHLKELNIDSPSITSAIERVELRHLRKGSHHKKSWYGLFGGNKTAFNLPEGQFKDSLADSAPLDRSVHQGRQQHIEKEINKLDQLIELSSGDLVTLTNNLKTTFDEYTLKMERKWLAVMLSFVRAGKQVCQENLTSWQDMKEFIEQ